MKELRGYQRTDAHIVDYEPYQLPGIRGVFRGPPVRGDRYIACVGAAQTFGRFVSAPFPVLLSRALGIEVLNLGRGGIGPEFHLDNPRVVKYLNRAQVVIVQVFSARQQTNSLFRIVDRARGINRLNGSEVSADQFYTWLLGQDKELARKIVVETRENYVLAMTQLLDAIKPPKILFWFSVRAPGYQEQLELPLGRLWGEFPQLVNQAIVDELRNHADVYVECVSRRGLPQRLIDRNGNPTSVQNVSLLTSEMVIRTENHYYPSPEMHEDAVALLVGPCKEMLNGVSSTTRQRRS